MFAYYFPPLGGSGVQRTLKYVKYLPAEGFSSVVVSGIPRWLPSVRDDALIREIPPGTIVARARTLPLEQIQGKLDGVLQRVGVTRGSVPVLWPDELVGWLPAALWHGLRVVRRYKPDVLYSTSLPPTTHLVALIIHRLTGLPWVADFRDAWTMNTQVETSASSLPRPARAWLEREVARQASYVTVADETMTIAGLSNGESKLVVIHNGVDPDDLSVNGNARPEPPADRFRLSYVGSLYGAHDGAAVWAALRELLESGKADPSQLEVRVVGHVAFDRANVEGLPVTFTGYMKHEAAITEMNTATALLFYRPPGDPVFSAKIFEYLTSGRPVLCVAHPDNLAYRLVQELGAGECADVRDASAVAAALRRMLRRWERKDLAVDPGIRDEVLLRFSRRSLAKRLAAVLRQAITEPTER